MTESSHVSWGTQAAKHNQRTAGSEPSIEPHTSSSHPLAGAGVGVLDPFAMGVTAPGAVLGLRPPPTRLWKSTAVGTAVLIEPFRAMAERSSTRCESRRCWACSFSIRSERDRTTLFRN